MKGIDILSQRLCDTHLGLRIITETPTAENGFSARCSTMSRRWLAKMISRAASWAVTATSRWRLTAGIDARAFKRNFIHGRRFHRKAVGEELRASI
jgi:hypothetical protein